MSETTAKLVTLRDKDTKFDVLESKMCSQCAYLTDVFSSGDRADSLQFDHHVNTLRSVPGVLRWFAVPDRSADSGHIDAAFVEPPTASEVCRTVEYTA